MIPRLVQVEGEVDGEGESESEGESEGEVEGGVEAGAAFDAPEFESVVLLITTRTSVTSDRFARPTWFLIDVAVCAVIEFIDGLPDGCIGARAHGASSPTNCSMSILTGAPW